MIYLYPMDSYGCGHYRIIWSAQAIADKYPDLADRIKLCMPGDPESGGIVARATGTGASQRVTDLKIPDDCEAVVLQRPSSVTMGQSIPYLKKAGIKVIVEIDDDLEAISPRHFAWRQMRAPGHSPGLLKAACFHADVVTASTPALVERYGFGKGVVLPNYIPRHVYEKVALTQNRWDSMEEMVVGWPGSILTHPDDLQVMGGAVAQVCKTGAMFRIVGGGDPDVAKRILGTDVDVTGSIPFDEWLPTIKQRLDVGVAPLALTPFNQSKSDLKSKELSAAGVPFACSPTREYTALGAGLIVRDNKPREWLKALRALVYDKALREHEIGRNHEIVQKNILEDHVDMWKDAWLQ